jgi:hypothetical protein
VILKASCGTGAGMMVKLILAHFCLQISSAPAGTEYPCRSDADICRSRLDNPRLLGRYSGRFYPAEPLTR